MANPVPQLLCRECKASVRVADKFCAACGVRLAGAGTPLLQDMPHERRQLTVMFCDLVGSTALAGRLDPEDLHAIFARYQRLVSDIVVDAGGVIARYQGDGILAYFGYPRAGEHDAEAAVRSARASINAVTALDLACRVGIATGTVVVGPLLESGVADKPPIVGQTPNLAARLQALAEPGAIVIDLPTKVLTKDFFTYRALGAMPLRGFTEPIPAYVVTGEPDADYRRAASHVPLLPLVGRSIELLQLAKLWHAAAAGHGAWVLVMGEPGIGKSRVVAELEASLLGETAKCWRFYCAPTQQDSILHPFISAFQRLFEWKAGATSESKLDFLEARLAKSRMESGADPKAAVALLAELMAIPAGDRFPPSKLDRPQQRALLLETLAGLVESQARLLPLLLIVEDTHWIDPTSRELVDLLIDRIAKLPVLLVVTQREDRDRVPAAAAYATIVLRRLDESNTAALISNVAGDMHLPGEMISEIAARADGIPLFVEELTRALMESGALSGISGDDTIAARIAALRIPPTLNALLMSRLDRVGPAREVARMGAAVGREFSCDLIAALTELPLAELTAALDRLEAASIIVRQAQTTTLSYVFKHALIQDAAYSTLLRGERMQLHARIAKVLADRFSSTGAVQPEILAHHLTEAGAIPDAIRNWLKAGRSAAHRSSDQEAARHLERGLQLVPLLPVAAERDRAELDLRLALGPTQMALNGYGASECLQTFLRARELAGASGTDVERFGILWGLWNVHFGRGELIAAKEVAEQAVALAARSGTGVAMANRLLGQTLSSMGAFDDAHQALSVAIEAGASRSESGSDLRMSADNEVVARVYLARALWSLGRLDESSDHALAAIERARSLGQAMTIAVERVALGLMRLPGIDTKAALARADDTISLCVEHRFAYLEQSARFNFGALISLEGDVRRGLGIMDEAFQNAEHMQTQLVRPMRLGLMAAARARLGETEMALRLIAEAMHQVNKTEERQFESGLFRIKGTMLIKAKQFDAATAALERSIDIAQRQGALSDELHTARLLAQLFAKSGRLEDAWALLEPRCRAFTQGADDPEVLQARAALAGLVQGRPVMSDRSTAI